MSTGGMTPGDPAMANPLARKSKAFVPQFGVPEPLHMQQMKMKPLVTALPVQKESPKAEEGVVEGGVKRFQPMFDGVDIKV